MDYTVKPFSRDRPSFLASLRAKLSRSKYQREVAERCDIGRRRNSVVRSDELIAHYYDDVH